MNRLIKVLIIENESLTLYSLKKAFEHLSSSNENLKFNITIAEDCKTVLDEMNTSYKDNPIDLVLLNINMPPVTTKKLMFVEDLALEFRALFPNVKIIVFASYCDNYKMNSLLKTLNPESVLIKSDIDFKELVRAIDIVLLEPPYYSKAVLRLIRSRIANDFVIDKIDKMILHYLSIGAKTKDLPNLVHLSKSGIDRRKRQLKDIFNVEKASDRMLLKIASENGFI